MTAASIRLATEADAEHLAALRRAWVEELSGPLDDGGEFERQFAAWYEGERDVRTSWIAFRGDDVVGMLNLTEFRRMPRPGVAPARWGYIANVFVLEAHRDAGIGAQLLDAAVVEAKSRGYARLVLNPSPRSVPFYRRAGFDPSGLLVLSME